MTENVAKIGKAISALAVFSALFAAFNLAGGIYWWFFSGFTWEVVGPIKISVHQWDRSWVNAMAAWLVAVLILPRPFYPRSWGRIFDLDPQNHSPAKSWAVFGIIPGAAVGFMVARSNFYMFPTLGHALALAAAFAILSAALHGVYAKAIDRLPLMIYLDRQADYRAGLRSGFYLLILMALVRWPLRSWEGRFFDSFWPFIAGGAAGLLAALALIIPARLKLGWLSQRRAMVSLLGVAVLTGAVSIVVDQFDQTRPERRVFLITLDTTRADRLSCYGHDRKTSPFLDSLAADGVRFARAICPMGTTDPSHVSMFTGVYPRTHGVVEVAAPITGPVASLPEYLRERGFATAAIIARTRLEPAKILKLPGFDYENGPRNRHCVEATAPQTFRRTANWLSQNKTRDVFMWIHFFDPHEPYVPHPDFPVRFTDTRKPCRTGHWLDEDEHLTPGEIQRCRDLYDGEIAYMDYWLQKTVEWIMNLEPQSSQPPLFIILADHGEALGDYHDSYLHFGFGHEGLIHNSVTLIPFIVYSPGAIPSGLVVEDLAETVDIAPTVLDYLFDADDFPSQGMSLRPAIDRTGKTDDLGFVQRRETGEINIKPHGGEPRYAVYKEDYKLMITPMKDRELFHLDEDLAEKYDLVHEAPDKADELEAELKKWLNDTPYTQPVKVERTDRDDPLIHLGYINPGGNKNKKEK